MNARSLKFPVRPRADQRLAPDLQLDLLSWRPRACAHTAGHPRRLASRASAVVRCEYCLVVLERLGGVALVAAGLELGALALDRGTP
jgi:hypothetical protein